MAHISEKEFYDEYDNTLEITRIIRKSRYIKPFKFLCKHFNDYNKPWVTATLLQENLCMPDHSNAYQILESFRILNMLSKHIDNKRKSAFYSNVNKHLWEYAKKESEKWEKRKK